MCRWILSVLLMLTATGLAHAENITFDATIPINVGQQYAQGVEAGGFDFVNSSLSNACNGPCLLGGFFGQLTLTYMVSASSGTFTLNGFDAAGSSEYGASSNVLMLIGTTRTTIYVASFPLLPAAQLQTHDLGWTGLLNLGFFGSIQGNSPSGGATIDPGGDFVIDNIHVNEAPEPSAAALVLAALAIGALRSSLAASGPLARKGRAADSR